MYYIDKTECLEKGIEVFPSIYIMGASATGKSTLVEMFLKKHPEVKSQTIDMEKTTEDFILKQLKLAAEHMRERRLFLVLENIPAHSEIYPQMVSFVENMTGDSRVILTG